MPGSFQGSTSVIEQPRQRTFAKGTGWATVRTWEGPRDDVFDFAKDLAATGGAENINLTDEGPTAKVQATYPDAQDSSIDATQGEDNVEWELIGNDLEKKLQTHSDLDPGSDATKITDMAAAVAAAAAGTPLDAGWGAAAQNVYNLLVQGVESYVVTHYVLRKTIKVARDSLVTASLSNVNKVEAPVGVPAGLFGTPTNQGGTFTIEWLKKPPSVRYLGKGKFSIQQEWWAGKWSTGLYGGTHAP